MIIGFCGREGSGKTYAAKYLADTYGYTIRSFATPLKEICKILFTFDDTQLYGTQRQKNTPDFRWYGATQRRCMQFIGTDLMRKQLHVIIPELGEDIWIKSFENWYLSQPPNSKVVIDDVRFQNEIDLIHKLGGIVVMLESGYVANVECLHESEKLDLSGYNYTVRNNEDEKLYENLDLVIEDCSTLHH